MIFQEHIHHRASRRILLLLLLHHNIPIHHQLKGIIKVLMLPHLQLVTLWITVLNSHHLLKKRRRINGSNSTFHNYSPNCGSKWILCIHTWACAHTYIYIYIHVYLMFLICSFFLHSWRCCVYCCSECLSNISFWWVWFIIAQSHLWESLWEIDLICLVSIYVIYYLFHVMWISIIPIKYATIMVFFFQINLYFILVLVNFMLLSFFVNCVKLICVIKNGIKLLTLIPRQYKWLSRVFYPIF